MPDIGATPQDHELGLIDSFIKKERRGRFKEMLTAAHKRRKVLGKLDHFGEFDERFVRTLSAGDENPEAIHKLLIAQGAPPQCYILSSNTDIDGSMMDLDVAVQAIFRDGFGTVLSCLPGRLAYFEGESPHHRFVLLRP